MRVNGAQTLVGGTTYRYSFTGAFADGAVTVNFPAGSVADGQGNLLAGSSQGFTVADVIAPTATLAAPVDGANIGDATLNARGYIDVTFADGGSSGLNLSTITDPGAEFTLGGAAAGGGVTVNGAPTLVSGTTYRYTFTGTFVPGAVTVDFVAGSAADNAGNPIAAAGNGFTVAIEDAVPPTAALADPRRDVRRRRQQRAESRGGHRRRGGVHPGRGRRQRRDRRRRRHARQRNYVSILLHRRLCRRSRDGQLPGWQRCRRPRQPHRRQLAGLHGGRRGRPHGGAGCPGQRGEHR
ncbi:MAG: Ig-like domain-containing protein [Planctomycetota bacterium]|nr:Ig-like domain-containing protein [Planctomycetota bacterium]